MAEVSAQFHILSSAHTSDLSRIRTSTGIKERSVLFSLHTFEPFQSFSIDIMHLLYNISRAFLSLILDGFEDCFKLSKTQIQYIDTEMLQFTKGFSWKVGPRPNVVLPGEYIVRWMCFVNLHDLFCRKKLSLSEVDEIGSLATRFVAFIEDVFCQYNPERVHVCKYVFHLLLHLKDNFLENGPLAGCSQYWVERYIGYIVGRLKFKQLTGTSIYKQSISTEAAKIN